MYTYLVVCSTLLLAACGDDSSVRFAIATSSATYAAGEPVRLTIQLRNDGSSEAGLSPVVDGNIEVLSLTRDGAAVMPDTRPIRYTVDLRAFLERAVEPVASGREVSIAWRSRSDGSGGRALRTVTLTGDRPSAHFYPLGQPGAYELRVRYRYAGNLPSGGRVVEAPSDEATVRFTLTP